ncbi:MAG: histidine kinase [Dermatophilaceae bacterium]
MTDSPTTFREDFVALVSSWLVVVFLQMQTLASLLTQADPGLSGTARAVGVAGSMGCSWAFVAFQQLLIRGQESGRRRPLLAAICLIALGLVPVSNSWTCLGLATAALILHLGAPRGLVVCAVMTPVVVVVLSMSGADPVLLVVVPAVSWLGGIVLYVLTRLVVVLRELQATREHLARVEVDGERHRISRDLHDIIGRTLVAVGLRNEAALRLIDRDVDACRRQLTEVQSAVINGQAQLRALTRGHGVVDLETELQNAATLCDRLGVTCDLAAVPVDDPDAAQLLATVIREAVTNMLKHSRPGWCAISVQVEPRWTVLSVVNDGCTQSAMAPTADVAPDETRSERPDRQERRDDQSLGTGLRDLTGRLEVRGGTMTAGPVKGGRYRVVARVPTQTPPSQEMP